MIRFVTSSMHRSLYMCTDVRFTSLSCKLDMGTTGACSKGTAQDLEARGRRYTVSMHHLCFWAHTTQSPNPGQGCRLDSQEEGVKQK